VNTGDISIRIVPDGAWQRVRELVRQQDTFEVRLAPAQGETDWVQGQLAEIVTAEEVVLGPVLRQLGADHWRTGIEHVISRRKLAGLAEHWAVPAVDRPAVDRVDR
jgi:hypothetical protein